MKKILILGLILLIVPPVTQLGADKVNIKGNGDKSFEIEWHYAYGDTAAENVGDLLLMDDGSIIVAGSVQSFGTTYWDFLLMKVDENGNQLWNQTYGDLDYEYAQSIIQTHDMGFAILGNAETRRYETEQDLDIWLVKTNKNGEIEWNQTFGSQGFDFGVSVIETEDQGFMIGGSTASSTEGDLFFRLIKTDEQGVHLWNKTYGGEGNYFANSFIETSEGDYIMSGNKEVDNEGDIWTVRLDSNGDQIWNNTYGYSGSFEGSGRAITTVDGGLLIQGWTNHTLDGKDNIWFVKTDINGLQSWNRTNEYAFEFEWYDRVFQTSDDGFALIGSSISEEGEHSELSMLKVNENGEFQWRVSLGGKYGDHGSSLVQLDERNFILGGSTFSFGEGVGTPWSNIWLVKLKVQDKSDDGFLFINPLSMFFGLLILSVMKHYNKNDRLKLGKI